MSLFRKLSRTFVPIDARTARGKARCRAYAVGDIHGRLDLLNEILGRIEADIESRPRAKNFIVFLGDLVDRGPDSAGVVERLRTYRHSDARLIFLSGNHEEVLLRLLQGEGGILASWLKFGGAECAQSYGISPETLKELDERSALKLIREKVPRAHREFIDQMGDTFRFGDYLFVHAGIRPGVPLEEQDQSDLRWIRDPFLSDAKEHGYVVVHGHTIVPEVEERPNRIGIDTGAYRSDILTAIVIEEDRRWYLASSSGGQSKAEAARKAL